MENDNFIAIQENKPEINWFVVILMSLYSQYTKDMIMTKDNKTVINSLLTKYYYNNDLSKTFYNIISHEILLLHLLRETGHINIRQHMIEQKNLNMPINFVHSIHKYLQLNCLSFFSIHNTNKYYCGINNYYEYTINADYQLSFEVTNDLSKATLSNKKDFPEIIMIQKEFENTDESKIVTSIISNSAYEKVFNIDNYDKQNASNIKSLNEVITYNNKKYKMDSCILRSKDDNKYSILFHYNDKQYSYSPNEEIKEVKWYKNIKSTSTNEDYYKNDFYNNFDFKKVKSNLIAIYVLEKEQLPTETKSSSAKSANYSFSTSDSIKY